MEAYDRVLRLADEVGDARVLMETGAARVRKGDVLLERNDAECAKRNLLEGIEVLLEWSRLGAETSWSLQATESHDRLGTPEDVLAEAAQGVATGYISLARVNQAQGGIRKAPTRLFKKPNN